MANNIVVKTYETILGEMIASYTSRIGVNDLNVGSAVTCFFETMAQAIYRSSGDIFSVLREFSLNRATGDALQRLKRDENLSDIPAAVATGVVTITDSNFNKISTKIYVGATSPNIGSTSILVSDASLFPATGSIYIGRGTPNIEGPLAYSSIVGVGSYYQINLVGSTTKYHNVSEGVILAQGGVRTIATGTSVKTATLGSAAPSIFTTTQAAIILDGETTITSVPIAAQEPGTINNVVRGTINEFVSPPFTGATVINPSPITTGKNEEGDDELRIRIKRSRASKGLGTAIAVSSSVLNASDPVSNTEIISSQTFNSGNETSLFIDNGSGYEPTNTGVGQESIVDSALGGEYNFQLTTGGSQTSVAKAFLETGYSAPFDINPNDRLSFFVGGILSEHVFASGDFKNDGFATAYEIVSSINADSTLKFSARTSNVGTKVVISAKTESNEDIQATIPTSGVDASIALGFPTSEAQTLRLYKNRSILNRNGKSAIIDSALQSAWAAIISGTTLKIEVDGTAQITYAFTDADFITEGTYTTVSASNSLTSWANVINAKVTGVTASISGTQLFLSSNLGANSRSQLVIDPTSTLVTSGMFTVALGLSSVGKVSDYSLSRNTAQISLVTPLSVGDSLTAGTEFTAGQIQTSSILGGIVTLTSDAYFWFMVDNQNASIINHGVSLGSVITITKPLGGSANVYRFTHTTNAAALANVAVGDYVIVWSTELDINNRLEGRVSKLGVSGGTSYFDMLITPAEYAAVVPESITFVNGLVFLRSEFAPQKVVLSAGTWDINVAAIEFTNDIYGAVATVDNDEFITISTSTYSTYGSIMLVTQNVIAKLFNFTDGDYGNSITSHIAIRESQDTDSQFPLFVHSYSTNNQYADTPAAHISSFISNVNLTTPTITDLNGIDPNVMVCMLNPYLAPTAYISSTYLVDAQVAKECVQIKSLSGTTINIEISDLIRRIRSTSNPYECDRYYVASPYDFSYNDSLVAVLDNDPSSKIFSIPLYRRAIANTTYAIDPTTFRAYDVDSGATTQFYTYFGNLSFNNYKAYMKARYVIDPITLVGGTTVAEDAILYHSALWGRDGERYRVGYAYPTVSDLGISNIITIGNVIDIKISLKSGAAVSNSVDTTTQWALTIAPNTPLLGIEEHTYLWKGSGYGTDPAIDIGVNGLKNGDYVTIISATTNDNTGTFRVCGATVNKIFTASCVAAASLTTGDYFTFDASSGTLYYVWYNIASGGGDPAPIGRTPVTVILTGAETAAQVAIATQAAIIATISGFAATVASDIVTMVCADAIDVNTTFTIVDTGYAASPRPDSFTITRKSGTGSILTGTNISMLLYKHIDTTASDIVTYITASLSDYLIASLVPDNGSTGAGVINSSTIEDNSFSTGYDGFDLIDGVNWILSSTVGAGPTFYTDFVFKNTLVMDKFDTLTPNAYAFRNGEEVRLIPVTARQINEFITTLAVSGITTLGGVSTSNRIQKIQIGTQTFGSGGAFQVSGGSGNLAEAGILGTSSKVVNTDYMAININRSSSIGVHVDQWVKLEAQEYQKKDIGFNNTGSITVVQNSPSIGKSTVTFNSKPNSAIYFGQPRNMFRDRNRAFHVEKHGSLVCISWDGITGGSPVFGKSVEFNDAGGGNIAVSYSPTTGYTEYTITSGNRNFNEVQSDDIITTSTFADASNNGTFKVLGISNNGLTISTNNSNGITHAAAAIGAGAITISTTIKEGDLVTIRSPFSTLNCGQFRVIRRYSNSIYINNPSAIEERVVVASNLRTITYDGSTGFNISIPGDMRITWGAGTNPSFGNLKMGDVIYLGTDFNANNRGPFMITKIVTGTVGNAYIECSNSLAVAEGPITVTPITGVFEAHISSMIFTPYENTVTGDNLVISGNVLDVGSVSNAGTYSVYEVLNKQSIVIVGFISSQTATVPSTRYNQVYVNEGMYYSGYKKVHAALVDPSNSNRYILLLNTSEQANKVNYASGVLLTAMSKLNFSELIIQGLDSYRYDTGLIGIANRIVYGDPRDTVTYPGVSAAGAEIFIQPPLIKRISISIDIRIQTGIAWTSIVDQVRNNIAALINSSPIGESIAISDIISTVNTIPGVKAIAINSPLYDSAHDVILINPSEKPFILDLEKDIVVSKIG